ncbi:hypothetical protein DVH05_028498 [Phytophthora capsici]|nr:hypothetical protein DVH05_028498 [Phytophthora capsici]
MEVKDVNWRSLWRELTSNGWKARPPRGIEQEHRYVPPGGNARGKEGEDYFFGTTAVIQNYLDRLSGPQDTSTQDSDVAGSREDVGPEEPQVLDVVAPVDNGGGADTIEDDNGADMPLEDAGCDQEAEPSVDEETKTEDHDQPPPRTPRRPVHRVGALPEIAIVGEDDDGGDDATDELVNSLNRMGPDDDPDTYEVFDSGNDSDADDFDKQQEADDAQLIVVDGSDDESDSEDDPIGGNGAGETRFNEGFLRALGGSTALESGALNSDVLRDLGLSGYEAPVSVDAHHILQQPYVPAQCGGDYPGLKDSYYGPSAAIKKVGETPLALFLFFMPPALWRDIAVESNLYHLSTINKRADAKYTKHKRKNPSSDKTRAQFKAVLQQIRPIQAVELLHMVGLLLARAIQPNRERMSHHWSTHDEGGISRGSFGNYMARDRFFHIMRNLHFSDNNDERSRVDRIWKIRPVVDALQKTFRSGYVPPPRLVFDEGMLPSFSSYNKTRVYLKAKPHKWGTKMFLTCCAESAYCIRFEIYAGKKQLASELPGVEPTSMPEGPAAVVRNMRAVLGRGHPEHYLVVTDRFYTCAALAVQLLAMNVYILGTALPNRYAVRYVVRYVDPYADSMLSPMLDIDLDFAKQ